MSYTTRTEEFGAITFTAPAATDTKDGYVWIETEKGYPSNERRQICYGGDFRGNTVTATEGAIKTEAQKWLRDRRKWMRAEGL
jgi:hypothetical protein